MKLNIFILALTLFCTTSSAYAACESVMGACPKEPTHDTSSHMKSQISNKIEKVKPETNAQAVNTTKLGSKKTNSAASLVQTVNKAVLK